MRGTEFAEMAAFVAIADRHSFAKAATHVGVARSTLSQNIRALEERLRVRLLNRTTRSVSLTEAGERLLARVRPALGELTAAANELDQSAQGPAGLLRVVVQPPVASFLMGPLLGRFSRNIPASDWIRWSRCQGIFSAKDLTLAFALASRSSATWSRCA